MKSLFKYLSIGMYILGAINFIIFFFLSITHLEFWQVISVYMIFYGISTFFILRIPLKSEIQTAIAILCIGLTMVLFVGIMILYIIYSNYNEIFIRSILFFILAIIFQAIYSMKTSSNED